NQNLSEDDSFSSLLQTPRGPLARGTAELGRSHADVDLLLLQMSDEGPTDQKEEREAYRHEPGGRVARRQGADGVGDQVVQDVRGQCIDTKRAKEPGFKLQVIGGPDDHTIESRAPARAKDLVRGAAGPLTHGPEIGGPRASDEGRFWKDKH